MSNDPKKDMMGIVDDLESFTREDSEHIGRDVLKKTLLGFVRDLRKAHYDCIEKFAKSKPYRAIVIKRFSPVKQLNFSEDTAINYRNPIPTQIVETEQDIINLGNQLYNAEYELWKSEHASGILETIIQSAITDLMDAGEVLKSIGTIEAKQAHKKLMRTIVRMQMPIMDCMMDCFESIYLKEGRQGVAKAIEKLTKKDVK